MTPETETYGGPLFVPDVDNGRGWQTDDLARAIAEPGLPLESARALIRNLTSSGRLHPYGRGRADKRRPYLYRPDQALVAAVCHRLSEAGISDGSAAAATDLCLNSWQADDIGGVSAKPPAPTPAAAIMVRHLAGKRGHQFELLTFRNAMNGKVAHSARLRHVPSQSGTTLHLWGPDYVPRSTLVVGLDSILDHICRDKAKLDS